MTDDPGKPRRQHWFEPVAAHLGAAYLRYSFTKGTVNEVDFLVSELGLEPGQRLLDVGCGPGRHSHELARRGIEVLGVDISAEFVALATADAPEGAEFRRLDARDLPFEAEFDAVISLCQGAFGLAGGPGARPVLDPDGAVLDGMARALRPGAGLALTAFSAYFQVRWLEDSDDFDAGTGVNHEHTSVRDEVGADAEVDVWTSCFTPRELRLLADRAGLAVDGLYSVTPGAYERAAPTIDSPEYLLLARRVA